MVDSNEEPTQPLPSPSSRRPETGPDGASADSAPSVVANRYEIREKLGAGGFGTVFRAWDRVLERHVAIKGLSGAGLSPEGRARALREARALARLQHPHVVTVHDALQEASGLYLVLELVEGESMARRLAAGPLDPAEAQRIVTQIAAGLAAAHELGIVHRDIKPDNILLTRDGEVKVADFGIARLLGEARITSEEVVVGTPSYMAPEQIQGGEVGPAADLFAVGCLLHEMVSGAPPFGRGRASEVLARILAGRPDGLPPTSGLQSTVSRLLEPSPAARPSAAELRDLLNPGRTTARPTAAVGASGPARLGNLWLLVFLFPLTLIAGFFVYYLMQEVEPVRAPEPAPARGREVVRLTPAQYARFNQDSADSEVRVEAGEPTRIVNREGLQWNLEALAASPVRLELLPERLTVSGRREDVARVVGAVRILQALEDASFYGEPNWFTRTAAGEEAPAYSAETFDLAMTGVPELPLLQLVARAVQWPVIFDRAAIEAHRDAVLDERLEDVSWDLWMSVRLSARKLEPIRFSKAWLITTAERAEDVRAAAPTRVALRRFTRVPAREAAEALRTVSSPSGLIRVNERLQSVVIYDHEWAFDGYERVIAGIDDTSSEVPLNEGGRAYVGKPIEVAVEGLPAARFFGALQDFTGLNFSTDPGLGEVTAHLRGVPWDESMVVAAFSIGAQPWWNPGSGGRGLMQVLPLSQAPTVPTAVATIRLERDDPDFYAFVPELLSDQGSFHIDRGTRTLVVSDRGDRVAFVESIVDTIDGME